MLIVLLKIDLSKEDVPGGEAFVGVLLLLSNTVLPSSALVIAILSFGFGVYEEDPLVEEESHDPTQEKQSKKGKEMKAMSYKNPLVSGDSD